MMLWNITSIQTYQYETNKTIASLMLERALGEFLPAAREVW